MAWNQIMSAFTPLGFSTYHALQVQVNRRFVSGVGFMSNYTFSKAISNVHSAFGDTYGANAALSANYYNLAEAKSISDADRTHAFKIAVQYELPFGKGRRFGSNSNAAVNAALGGWTIQYIGNYTSGWPLGITGSATPNSNFSSKDFTDGMSNTIAIGECADRDTDRSSRWVSGFSCFSQDNGGISGQPSDELFSRHPGGVYVAFADGKIHFVSTHTAPYVLGAICTRSGGEIITEF